MPFHGRRVTLQASLRCEGVTHGATIWVRVDGIPGHVLAFDNLKKRPGGWLFGEVPWTVRRIAIDVPPGAVTFHFGFFLKGAGSLWAANFSVEEADAASQATAQPTEQPYQQPEWITPSNLHFSDVIVPIGDGQTASAS